MRRRYWRRRKRGFRRRGIKNVLSRRVVNGDKQGAGRNKHMLLATGAQVTKKGLGETTTGIIVSTLDAPASFWGSVNVRAWTRFHNDMVRYAHHRIIGLTMLIKTTYAEVKYHIDPLGSPRKIAVPFEVDYPKVKVWTWSDQSNVLVSAGSDWSDDYVEVNRGRLANLRFHTANTGKWSKMFHFRVPNYIKAGTSLKDFNDKKDKPSGEFDWDSVYPVMPKFCMLCEPRPYIDTVGESTSTTNEYAVKNGFVVKHDFQYRLWFEGFGYNMPAEVTPGGSGETVVGRRRKAPREANSAAHLKRRREEQEDENDDDE